MATLFGFPNMTVGGAFAGESTFGRRRRPLIKARIEKSGAMAALHRTMPIAFVMDHVVTTPVTLLIEIVFIHRRLPT